MRYKATFTGQTLGAIGIKYPIVAYCYGENEEEARLDLYTRYQHVFMLKLVPEPENGASPHTPTQNIKPYAVGT